MLRICLFRDFTLTHHDKPVGSFNSRKAEALLAYLVCQARPLSRETLATIFWDDSDPEQAMANLRKLLSILRKHLADYLIIERQTVAFNHQAPYWLDSAEFVALATAPQGQAAPAQWQRAVTLYQGDFLAGLPLPDARDFEAWAALERERLRRHLVDVLRALTQHFLQQRTYKTGISYARRLIALDPLSEYAHRQLMLLLARSGRLADAIAQYQSCARLLAEELGVTPTQATTALYRRLQTAVSDETELPELTTAFVGREEEKGQIHHYLNDPRCRLLTLLGPGGIGKTRLALQVAAERTADYLHGVHFVTFAALDSISAVTSVIADALNISLAGPGAPLVQLLNQLQGREMLLILDNCETLLQPDLAEGVAVIAAMLRDVPQVTVLATSRERFHFQAEQVFALTGLPYPEADALPETAVQTPALQLFAKRAREARASFCLTPENLPHAVTICRLVEGSPLAIELAAAAAAQDTAVVAAAITHSLDFLRMAGKTERHRSLRAVFDSSWAHLHPAEQTICQMLSVFRRGFTAEAAFAITGAHYTDLLGLVDKSFLQLGENGRYHLHEVIRYYAAAKLAEDQAAALAAAGQHADFYSRLAQRHGADLNGPHARQAMASLRANIDNVRQAWQWAAAHADVPALARAAPGLAQYYRLRGPFQEGAVLFATAVSHLSQQPAASKSLEGLGELLALCHVLVAGFHNEAGHYEQAAAQVQLAWQWVGEGTAVAAAAHLELGRTLINQGSYDAARSHLETTLYLAQSDAQIAIPDYGLPAADYCQGLLAEGYRLMGLLDFYHGHYEAARAQFETALHMHRRQGNRWSEAGLLSNLGVIAKKLGELPTARIYYEQGLQIAADLGNHIVQSKLLINLGVVLRSLGNLAGARAAYEEALDLKRQLGERQGESLALNNLGSLLMQQGDYENAHRYFMGALQLYQEMGRRRDEAMTLSNLGLLVHMLGDEAAAVTHSQVAQSIAHDLGDRITEAYAYTHLADGLVGLSRLEEAAAAYKQALAIREELGETSPMVDAQAGLAQVARLQGDVAGALALVEAMLPVVESGQVSVSEQPLRVYLTCYETLMAVGDGRASAILACAYDLLQKQAAQLADAATRRTFLAGVAVHQAIMTAYTRGQ